MTDIAGATATEWLAVLGLCLVHSLWQATCIALAAALVLREIRETQRYVVAYAALMAIPCVCALTAGRVFAGMPASISLPIAGFAGAPWIGLLWVAGVGASSTRLVAGWRRLRRLRASATPAAERWQTVADAVGRRLGVGRAVRLVETRLADVPGVIGWLSPLLLFPAGLLGGLPPAHVHLILAHELAHVRRNDYFWNLVQTMVETVFFFHPAVWWLSRRVRAERELRCDDLVVDAFADRQLYAEALTSLERFRSPASVLLPAASGGDLLVRIRRLIDRADPEPMPVTRVVLAVAGVMALVTVAMIGGQPGTGMPFIGIEPSVWLGAVLGIAVGARHALEPDHLVALSTLVAGERTTWRGARLGMSWGVGHTLTLFLVAGALALVRASMPESAEAALEAIVGLMLIALGLRALRLAVDVATRGPDVWHRHGAIAHRHCTSGEHVHVGRFSLARGPFMVGMVHGLAGSGALAAMATATMPTVLIQVVFIALFGLGSTVGMAALSGAAGLPLARLGRSPALLAWTTAAIGAVSLIAGVVWGVPVVRKWI